MRRKIFKVQLKIDSKDPSWRVVAGSASSLFAVETIIFMIHRSSTGTC